MLNTKMVETRERVLQNGFIKMDKERVEGISFTFLVLETGTSIM